MHYSKAGLLVALCALAACATTPLPLDGPAPSAKPALASPPASMMTPQGY